MISNIQPIKKLIVVGDTHFGFMSNSREWFENASVFFYDQLIPYMESLPDIEDYSLLILGDTYDKKQVIDTYIQNKSLDIIDKLRTMVPVFDIIGNHDTPKERLRHINNCKPLNYMDNVHLFVDPVIIPTSTGEKILLMPWMHPEDDDPERRCLAKYGDEADYCFAHTEVQGFHYETKPIDHPDSLTIEELKCFKRFWSGHVHKRQARGNVCFAGTPYHTRLVEYKNEVGFTILEFDNLVDGLPKETFIENKVSPKHRKINIDTLLDMTPQLAGKICNNNYVKIRVTTDDLSIFDINRIFAAIPKGYKHLDYELIYSSVPISDDQLDDVVTLTTPEEVISELQNTSMEDSISDYLAKTDYIPYTKETIIDVAPIRGDVEKSILSYYNHILSNQVA